MFNSLVQGHWYRVWTRYDGAEPCVGLCVEPYQQEKKNEEKNKNLEKEENMCHLPWCCPECVLDREHESCEEDEVVLDTKMMNHVKTEWDLGAFPGFQLFHVLIGWQNEMFQSCLLTCNYVL